MAHALDFNEDGTAKFVSVRENAWHGLGTIIPDYVSTEEMVKLAGLDYEVTKEEVLNAKTGEVIPNSRATTRSTDGKTLGIVGTRYHVIQNKTMFEIGEAIIADEAKWETAGALHGGSVVFALARLNREIYIAGEEIDPYFLVENSHDGSKAMRVTLSPIRVVCQNTLNMAMRGSKRIVNLRHTPNYENRLAEAQKTLGLVKAYYTTFEEQATELVNKLFTKAMFENLAATLIPIPDDASKTVAKNAESERESLIQCYFADDLNNVRGTAWAAYNAVADFSDHHSKTRGLTGRSLSERNFERAFHDVDIKDKALEIILATV